MLVEDNISSSHQNEEMNFLIHSFIPLISWKIQILKRKRRENSWKYIKKEQKSHSCLKLFYAWLLIMIDLCSYCSSLLAQLEQLNAASASSIWSCTVQHWTNSLIWLAEKFIQLNLILFLISFLFLSPPHTHTFLHLELVFIRFGWRQNEHSAFFRLIIEFCIS